MAQSVSLTLCVNNKQQVVDVPADATLLTVLRDKLRVLSPKRGCNQGVCGSCTVKIDGVSKRACLTLAAMCDDKTVDTVEGFVDDQIMLALQQNFRTSGAVQCGFCTAGMLVSAHALLTQNLNPSVEEIQQALSGNICRCTGYRKIIDGVMATAKDIASSRESS